VLHFRGGGLPVGFRQPLVIRLACYAAFHPTSTHEVLLLPASDVVLLKHHPLEQVLLFVAVPPPPSKHAPSEGATLFAVTLVSETGEGFWNRFTSRPGSRNKNPAAAS
jgi:hypothetical protein